MSGRSPRWFTGIKPSYEANFSDNTWEQIIAACQRGTVPETWAVGDQKTMTINGISYQIDIIGKNHDTYTAGGTAPLTFQMHECYHEKKRMNLAATNKGGWTSCDMRTKHLPGILSKMPTEVQNSIREVNKLTSAGDYSTTIVTTADKLFLLSEIEIFGIVDRSVNGEGTLYDYYKAAGSRIKTFNGTATVWRERSPSADHDYMFCNVYSTGTSSQSDANYDRGVAFAFCF